MSILYNSTSSKIILAVTILALVIQLAISQVIAGSITSALASMRAVCEKLRDGDFRSGGHALDRGDEFGHLSGTLMQMQEKMASYMKGIYGTVQNINSAAANLKEASMQSAQAAIQSAEAVGESAHLVTDQECALNDSSSLLEKVNTSIQEMRSHAEEVSANSKQAANEADHGQGVLEKSVAEIRGVENSPHGQRHQGGQPGRSGHLCLCSRHQRQRPGHLPAHGVRVGSHRAAVRLL
jgi:methyl-accepting chemotaxis protein